MGVFADRRATLLAAYLGALALACSSGTQPPNLGGVDRDSGPGLSEASIPLGCTGPYEGCRCGPSGATLACAAPHVQIGTHVICPPGLMVCTGGLWGACAATDVSASVASQVQDYESTCTAGAVVQWNPLALTGQVPAGATIVIGLQSAASRALLDQGAYEVAATIGALTPTPWPSVDVPTSLTNAGQDPRGVYLRVTALLTPAAGGEMPTVSFMQAFTCVNP